MAINWTNPAAASDIHAAELDSLADGSETAAMTLDNSTDRALYGLFRLTLGSLTPATGGSATIKIYGPNADVGSTPLIQQAIALTTSTGAKDVSCIMQLPPFSLKVTVVNNSGVALAASGNDLTVQAYSEEDV